MVDIPQSLQNKNFRFVLIATRSKAPYEVQWQKINNYPFNHNKIKEHKWNLGIVCGYGGLVVLDVDNKDKVEEFDKKINTFTIKTGSGGRHYYFICKTPFQRSYYILNGVGELRTSNSQVVVPGSIHKNGKEYKVLNNCGLQVVSKSYLYSLIGHLLNGNEEVTDTSRSGVEWGEVCGMIEAGYDFDECDKEMRLFGHTKWVEKGIGYRVGTYCSALKMLKKVR